MLRGTFRMASREAMGKEYQEAAKLGARLRDERTAAGNGSQQGFATGATRSSSEGKIDFEGHFNPEVLAIFGDYMNRHRVQRDGRVRASDNWQQGIPLYRYVKSLVRHVLEFWRMWRGTAVNNVDNGQLFTFNDVLCAIMFNTMGILYEMNRRDPGALHATFVTGALRVALEQEDQAKNATDPAPPSKKESDDYRKNKAMPARDIEQIKRELEKGYRFPNHPANPSGAYAGPCQGQSVHSVDQCEQVDELMDVGEKRYTCPQDGEKNCCGAAGAQRCEEVAFLKGIRRERTIR